MLNSLKSFFAIFPVIFLVGCGSDPSNGSDPSGPENTGVFYDSAVEGVEYKTQSLSGVTNSKGEFKYRTGESVTFSLDKLTFPKVLASSEITPLTLAKTVDIEDNTALNIATLLQTLDHDQNPDNGITIKKADIKSKLALTEIPKIDFSKSHSEFATKQQEWLTNKNSISKKIILRTRTDVKKHLKDSLKKTRKGSKDKEFFIELKNDFKTIIQGSGTIELSPLSNDTGLTLVKAWGIDTSSLPASTGTARKHNSKILFTPKAGFSGKAVFKYYVQTSRKKLYSTITINIAPKNHKTIARDFSLSINEDTPITIPFLSHASDIDRDPLLLKSKSSIYGQIDRNNIYTPPANFNGTDTITYSVNDSTDATVTITVKPINDRTIANNFNITINEDTPTTIPFLSNASDIDQDNLVLKSTKLNRGTLSTSNVYTPPANFNGTDTITYSVNDSTDATVTITVKPINDRTIANNFNITINEDTPTTIPFLSHASDIDQDNLVLNSVIATQGSIGSNNIFSPNPNFNGSASITYKVNDSEIATVTVTINPINDAHTGSISISSSPVFNTTLSIADTVADIDGISNSTYIWKLDGVEVATGVSQYKITDTGKSTIQVIKRYNDQTGLREIVSSTKAVLYPSLEEAIDSLTINLPSDISAQNPSNFKFSMIERAVDSYVDGYKIQWSSPDQEVSFLREDSNSNYLTLSHPNANAIEKSVTLNAKISDGTEEKSKSFSIKLQPKTIVDVPLLIVRFKFKETEFHQDSNELYEHNRMFVDDVSAKKFFLETSSGRANMVPAILPAPDNSSTSGVIFDTDINDGVIEYHSTKNQRPADGTLESRRPEYDTISEMFTDLDSYIDFSQFDTNGDKVLQTHELSLFINFATCDMAHSSSLCYPNGSEDAIPGIWPAASQGHYFFSNDETSVRLGGTLDSNISWVTDYIVYKHSPDLKYHQTKINIVVHEMGHSMFEQPDLYNTNQENSPYNYKNLSIRHWGVMGNPHTLYSYKPMPQQMLGSTKVDSGFVDPIYSTTMSREDDEVVTLSTYMDNDYHPLFITNKDNLTDIVSSQYIATDVRGLNNGFDRALSTLDGVLPSDSGLSMALVNPSIDGNSFGGRWSQMRKNILTTDENSETAHTGENGFFVTGHSISEKTKFHGATYDDEHTEETNIRIPSITQLTDSSFQLTITNQ